MTLALHTVLAWRPGELATAADRLRRRIAELSAETEQLGSAKRATVGHWRGAAAGAAHLRLEEGVACGDELVASLEWVRSRLDGIADSLGYARDRVKAVADDADAHQFRVADDGTVHPPYLPPPSLAPVSSGELADYAASYDTRADQLLDEAERRTRELREALREAELADEHQASTLRGLELPAALLDRTFALVPQLSDLWSTPRHAVVFPAGWQPWPAMARGSDSIWTAMVTQTGSRCFPGGVVAEYGDPDGSGTGYYGGGFLTGPDGRHYPLVVPQVVTDGAVHRADGNWQTPPVQDLAGLDSGWHQVGAVAGVAQFGSRAPTAMKVLLGTATVSGMQTGAGTGYRRRNDLLGKVRVDGLGAPSLRERDEARPESPERATEDPRPVPAGRPGTTPERGELGVGTVSLLTNAAEAAVLVKQLDDHLTHGYAVSLQQNEDGRRRALLNLYDVYDTPDDAVVVQHSLGYVGPDGDLRPVRSAPLYSHHVVVPATR